MIRYRAKRTCFTRAELYAVTPKKSRQATPVARRISLRVRVLLAVTAVLLVPLIIMLCIRSTPSVAEWWTRHIQAGWEKLVGTLTSWIPFSVFELFIAAAVIIVVYLFGRMIFALRARRFQTVIAGLLGVVIAIVYILDMYVLSMGFGYYRAAMPLPQAGRDYDKAQAIAAAEYFAADYNALSRELRRDENGCVVCPYSFSELADLIAAEYEKLDDDYFAAYTPTVKPVVNSFLLSDMLITGITFLPFGEATVNTLAPPSEIPATMAHELAHTKGVQREGDANLLSYYILLSSDNDYLRYCGYYTAYDSMPAAVRLHDDREEYERLYDAAPREARAERAFARKYWNSQPDFIGNVARFFNDIYLSLNGAINGTGSYNDGNISDVIISPDPDTGEQQREIYYSQTQKMMFAIYEARLRDR